MKYYVIANPASAHGRGAEFIPRIQRALKKHGLDFELAVSQYPWHAAELSEQAARRGADVVVSAGGDGTANEVANGLLLAQARGMRHTALGLISIGTGNDLAAGLGLSADLDDAILQLKSGASRWVDVGFARSDNFPAGRYFINCVGVGFDAAGTILARDDPFGSGFVAYLFAAIQTIFTYHASAPTLRIEVDGATIVQKSLMVSVMNGRRIGGGFLTAPDARMDDGYLDLCVARAVGRLRMFVLLPHFVRGTQSTQPEIRMLRGKRVKITAVEGVMPVQMDGEIFSENGLLLEIEIYPGQLQIVGAS